MANHLGVTWATRANLIRGIYAGYLVYTEAGILTTAVSNWLTGIHTAFEVRKVSNGL